MAIGSTPNFTQGIPLGGMLSQHMLVLAYEAASQMGWKIVSVGADELVARTAYGDRRHHAEITVSYDFDAAFITSSSLGNEMFDKGRNKKNVLQFIQQFDILKNRYSIEEIEARVDGLTPTTDGAQEHPSENQEEPADFPSQAISSYFSFAKGYLATPSLLYLNVAVFAVTVLYGADILSPSGELMLDLGANTRSHTLMQHQWWRVISSSFLHFGISHLILNMVALAYIGRLLEPVIGTLRFIILYLLCAAVAGMASACWHVQVISAGASGPIFGMFGVFLVLLTTNLVRKELRIRILPGLVVFIALNLFLNFDKMVDSAAHLGGFLSGMLCGAVIAFDMGRGDSAVRKFTCLASLVFGLAAAAFGMTFTVKDDSVLFNKKLSEFIQFEKLACEVYSQLYADEGQFIEELDRSDYYWNENLAIVDQMKQLSLPETAYTKMDLLRKYCRLRIETNGLISRSVSRHTEEYRTTIEKNMQQIDDLMHDIRR